MMSTLILGASGATGSKLVKQLLQINQKVKIIVRNPAVLPAEWKQNEDLEVIQASINEVKKEEMVDYLKGCQSVACCLGHNLSLKGMYGKPRKLVTDAIKLVCTAIKEVDHSTNIQVVLMNTSGNRNPDVDMPHSTGERIILGLIRALVPPHPDNEQAAEYLRTQIGKDNTKIDWVVVRPDSLIDEDEVSEYEVYPSPIRSPLFNPGKTSRINVGHFMACLLTNRDLLEEWKGKMPVIYNSEDPPKSKS